MAGQNNLREEKQLEKTLDFNLLRRLLKYARPYSGIIAACIIMLLFLTLADLARPYIIQISIDDYINGYDTPMAAFPPGQEPVPGVELNGEILVRETSLADSAPLQSRRQMLFYHGQYFLIQGAIDTSGSEYTIDNTETGYVLSQGEKIFPAQLLTADEQSALREMDISAIYKLGLLFILIITAAFLLNYGQVYLLQLAGQRIIRDMRTDIFSHLQQLSLKFFNENPAGRLVTRVANDTETLNEMFTSVIVNLFRDIFLLFGIIIAMLKMNTQLALVSILTLPLIAGVTIIFRIKAREAYREVRVKLAAINSVLSENIAGIRIIQIFNQQYRQYLEFDHINQQHYQANLKEVRTFAVFRPAMDLFQSFAIALVLWYGGKQIISGYIEFGVLFAFINYVQQFFRPINDLTEKYNVMQSAMASSERIFQLLDSKDSIPDPEHPVILQQIKGAIKFDHVWFAYDNKNWVLRDISFEIEPKQTVAFVGATGAGKSSIINLLSRLYDIQSGRILIDGIDIRLIKKEQLRHQIGVVLQDVFLFSDDIASNISMNNPDITGEKIREAARLVNADSFIAEFPGGYHHPVEERGATLSTGQRQLLSFARALAYDPGILILDEATANIDTTTELLIQKALSRLTCGRTTIVVAHRLSTIQHADKIIVMHKGTIRETGTHQQLLDKGGIYYDLYRLQYEDQK